MNNYLKFTLPNQDESIYRRILKEFEFPLSNVGQSDETLLTGLPRQLNEERGKVQSSEMFFETDAKC